MKSIAALLLALIPYFACAQTVNPNVTQSNIRQTICVPGWSATVRPPVNYTNRIKRKLMSEQGLPWSESGKWELDHSIPISSGGNPRDPDNLALQIWTGPKGAHAKDVVELRVHRLVCSGKVRLPVAQACFKTDWSRCP